MLRLRERSLLFEANDLSLNLFMPFGEIENVDMELKIISKTLSVETTVGLLQFADLTEGGIKRFYVTTQKTIDTFRESNEEKPDESNRVKLSEEELEFIKKRRADIEKDLEKPEEYKEIMKLNLYNTDIVNVYRVVFSGKPIIVNGK